MILGDRVRMPSPVDLAPDAYKDWLHVILFGPDRSMVLINLSLHGNPADSSSLAVAAVLLHTTDGWFHNIDIAEAVDASVSQSQIQVGDTRIGFEGQRLRIGAITPHVSIDAVAEPTAVPLVVENPITFGTGWIAWRACPRMSVTGKVNVLGERWPAAEVIGYHDHNWGRWHWGDDVGWEWATLTGAETTLVLAGTGGRDHRHLSHRLWVWTMGRLVTFDPRAVTVTHHGKQQGRVLRVPGAMAALHSERRDPVLPSGTRITASDGFDTIDATIRLTDSCQIITADPIVSGSGFVHEMAGSFQMSAYTGAVATRDTGPVVSERVT